MMYIYGFKLLLQGGHLQNFLNLFNSTRQVSE